MIQDSKVTKSEVSLPVSYLLPLPEETNMTSSQVSFPRDSKHSSATVPPPLALQMVSIILTQIVTYSTHWSTWDFIFFVCILEMVSYQHIKNGLIILLVAKHSTVWINRNLFNQSSFGGHLGHF